MNPELKCTSKILKYYFCYLPMDFMRVFHIPSNKTTSKGNVGMRMGKIKKDTNKMMLQGSNNFGESAYERQHDSRLKGRMG